MVTKSQRSDFLKGLQDPLNAALKGDRENLAAELKEVLDGLQGFDQDSIKAMLYSAPRANGKWEWIQDLSPPFDVSEIMHMCKEEYGGGEYVFRLMVDGKLKKTLFFNIRKDKNEGLMKGGQVRGEDQMSLFQLMMAQQSEARADAQAANDRMTQLMMQSNQQTMQMFAAMNQQSTAMLTAMLAGREKLTDFLPLLQRDGGGMKEALETLVLAKGLFSGEGDKDDAPGFDADNVVGSLVRMAGPVASAISRAVGRNGQAQAPHPAALDYTGAEPEPDAPLMMPAPAAQPALPPPPGVPRDTIAGGDYAAGRFPVLEAVRDDVVFMFQRGYHPQAAAAAIYDRVADLGVTEEQLGELVLAFTSSPDVLAELAAAGIDLRSNADWAHAFFSELVACHAEAAGFDDDADAEPADQPGGGADRAAGTGRGAPDA